MYNNIVHLFQVKTKVSEPLLEIYSNPLSENNTITDWNKFLEEAKAAFEEKWIQGKSNIQSVKNFDQLKTLGMGTFGRVVLVRHKVTRQYYAMKILDKENLVSEEQVEHTLNEKKILLSIKFPFIINMEFCYKDNSYIYFMTPFIAGGELFTYLRTIGNFSELQSKFYAAQVLLGLEYLHYLNLVYRDLKPENITISLNGYLKIVDFGLCKKVDGRTYTLCGTPDYLAPEVVLKGEYGKAVDVWAWGVLVYEMTAGYTPFYSKNTLTMYERIAHANYSNVRHFSRNLKNLLQHVLQVDVTRRYGNLQHGYDDIKKHAWFKSTNWMDILNQKMKAPYLPVCSSGGDTSNFDDYDEKPLRVSSCDKFRNVFKDF